MILTLDVGNTETTVGLFEGDALAAHWRLSTLQGRTADEYGLLFRTLLRESAALDVVSGAIIASVVPPLTPALASACERHLGVETRIVDARSDLPIRIDIEEPLTVGADRIANTLAAARLYGTDTIAVDLGTATTFDCISADGVFLGGVIAPGIATGAETLTRRTAQLPRVEPRPPASVIGRRTASALQSGLFYSAVASIDGIVTRIRDEWGGDPLVVATGGLAPVIAPHCRAVARIEPFLTLHGLRFAWEELGG